MAIENLEYSKSILCKCIDSLNREEVNILYNLLKNYYKEYQKKCIEIKKYNSNFDKYLDKVQDFEYFELSSLTEFLNTDYLTDFYDDSTGRMDSMDLADTIKYYENRKFGIYEYEIRDYYEIPHLISSNYKNQKNYLEYRENVEKETVKKVINKNDYKIYKESYNIINEELKNIYNNSKSFEFKLYYDTYNIINKVMIHENTKNKIFDKYNDTKKDIRNKKKVLKELEIKHDNLKHKFKMLNDKYNSKKEYRILNFLENKIFKMKLKYHDFYSYDIKNTSYRISKMYQEIYELEEKNKAIKFNIDIMKNNKLFTKKENNKLKKNNKVNHNSIENCL